MSTLRNAALTALFTGAALCACSAREDSATAVPASALVAPGDGPCAIVTDAEVRKVFPGAESGVRDHSMDQYGMASCKWETPANTLAVQTFTSTETVENELRGRMLGFLDPLKPGLRDGIRYDKIAGIGDSAMAVAVKADEAGGILADSAMLAVQRGDRVVVLFTRVLVDGDPAASIKALEALAPSAALRL